jgi:hypothetical protein
VQFGTGTGKSLTGIIISIPFIEIFSKIYHNLYSELPFHTRRFINELDANTPSIFVLGFGGTKSAFIRELLKFPELGFITFEEQSELKRLQGLARTTSNSVIIKRERDYYLMLKRRITNKIRGGFYRFYGYQEFLNSLFITDVNIASIEQEILRKASGLNCGDEIEMYELYEQKNTIDTTLERVINEYISNGKIQINQRIMKQIKNSVVLCDEIHNTYNYIMKNIHPYHQNLSRILTYPIYLY